MKFLKSPFSIQLSLTALLCLTSLSMSAQKTNSLLWEPEVSLDFETESRWSYSFGIANRTLFYTREDGEKVADLNQEHIELNHFTSYKTGPNTSVAFGLRYRFRELFNEDGYDEFRTIQQLKYAPENNWNLAHRFRLEERFRHQEPIFRPRYAVSTGIPLGEEFGLGIATETLYSLQQGSAPELDQRFSVEIENSSLEGVELNLGLEYQYEDYLHDAEGELFIQSGVSFIL